MVTKADGKLEGGATDRSIERGGNRQINRGATCILREGVKCRLREGECERKVY
jgi:hypothetical protein